MSKRIFIIAEAGVNHNGSLKMAFELIDAARAAGADAVKFQSFKADKLVTRTASKAAYQKQTTSESESQRDMLKKLELSDADHEALIEHCRKVGIEFLSTPFDTESMHMLVGRFGVTRLKLPSGELTNAPFFLEAARTGRPAIVSTGMSTLGEIEAALGVLAFGYVRNGEDPSLAAFEAAYSSPAGAAALVRNVTLLHCTTEYPAPLVDVNLRAMDTLAAAFGLAVGYSDHTDGIAIPIAAAARGATLIEKHFTLDRDLPGPDHRASLNPDDLKRMVQGIRDVESALGLPRKAPAMSELKNRSIARKSLVAAVPIAAGEILTERHITVKRPGSGRSPMEFWGLLNTKASRAYDVDELL